MSIPLVVNGATFNYPVNFDEGWGVDATGWAQAVTNGMLQRAGGNFPLLADANFGTSFGLIAPYYKSATALIATSGVIRLAKTDVIDWRNNANLADNVLAINSIDQLTYNGVVIGSAGGVTSITGTANEIIASSSTGAVTLSTPQAIGTTSSVTFGQIIDSGLTASELVVTDGSRQLVSQASPTLTEIGYVGGVTSSIQTQINATVAVANAALPLAGGTMSGDINANGHHVSNLALGGVSGDAVAFQQLKYFQAVQSVSSAITTSTSSTYAACAGLNVVLTPSSTSHRVKVTVSFNFNSGTGSTIHFTIMRNSVTDISGTTGGFFYQTSNGLNQSGSFSYIDSPATTSAVGYELDFKNDNNTTTITCGNTTQTAVIMAEEIL